MLVPTIDPTEVPDPLPEGTTILDVREDVEWNAGHIDGALHIPMGQVPTRMAELPEGDLLVVCHVGARSARVTAYLVGQGREAANIDGGLVAWVAAGRPMLGRVD
jgi:rhodanese-related sulfurtransferase